LAFVKPLFPAIESTKKEKEREGREEEENGNTMSEREVVLSYQNVPDVHEW